MGFSGGSVVNSPDASKRKSNCCVVALWRGVWLNKSAVSRGVRTKYHRGQDIIRIQSLSLSLSLFVSLLTSLCAQDEIWFHCPVLIIRIWAYVCFPLSPSTLVDIDTGDWMTGRPAAAVAQQMVLSWMDLWFVCQYNRRFLNYFI